MTTTKKGYALAEKLRPYLEEYAADERVISSLSKICRHSNTLLRIANIRCSVNLSEARQKEIDRDDDRAEANIHAHLHAINERTGKLIRPLFVGDPRAGTGCKLVLPEGWSHLYDCFAKEGILVP